MRSPSRVVLLLCLVAHAPLLAQAPNDTTHRAGWGWDLSSLLTGSHGFVPVPFAFGNPVVGFGGGLGIVFYRPAGPEEHRHGGHAAPATVGRHRRLLHQPERDWGVAGGLYRPWRNDRYRYLGIVGGGQVGLNYFGVRDSPFQHNPLDYQFEPVGTLQRVQARIADFPLYVGAEYAYVHTRSLFDSALRLPVELPKHEQKIDIGGLARQPGVRHAQQLPRCDERRRSLGEGHAASPPGSAARTASAGSTRSRWAMPSRGTCGDSPADST